MKIAKKDVERYLSSFLGDFREIFFERSKTFEFSFLNGVFKVPTFSTLEGFSVLSRTGKKEYFRVFSGLSDIEKKIDDFKKEFFLDGSLDKTVSLNGKDVLRLKDTQEVNFSIDHILKATLDLFVELIKPNSLISSSEISLSLSYKSFVVGNTKGNFSSDTNFYNTYFLKLIGEKDGNKEEIHEKITGTNIMHKINKDTIKKLILKSIETLERQLDGIPSPSGKMYVIIGNEAGGTIIHEAVGHGLEADLQSSSVYKGKIGQKVASDLVSVVDNPTIPHERGFYNFDHEGYPSKNTVLIENGILKSYLHNVKTASKFGVESTGHGRKESYKHKSLVRMGNTYLLPGRDKKKDLIKRVDYGIYVSRMGGGQVNTTTGDFVFKVQNGYLIENGNLTKNIRGATLSGNGPEMLNQIYGICDDLEFFDGGTCGKGQYMPVSDGVPTILTRLKVSGMK